MASGTDALELALRAAGVGPGDRVATVSFTFLATVDAILHAGARPLYVEIDPTTFTMDPKSLERALRRLAPAARRRVKAVIPVHLFGHPCDMSAIRRIARRYGLRVVEDCAQAAGARWRGRPVGSWGHLGCFSFFPSKNLGAFGDGGAVVTDSAALAGTLRRLRNHGRREDGQQVALGRNSRLDELQAAILRVKLKHLPGWVGRRRALARSYTRQLSGLASVRTPEEMPGARHSFGLYCIRIPRRDAVQRRLAVKGIATQAYYPVPVHRQPLHRRSRQRIHLPHTRKAAGEILALPLFPELTPQEVRRIVAVLREAAGARP